MAEHAATHGGAGAGARHAGQYTAIFVLLGVLTLVELGVARTPGIARPAVIVALVALAVSKAALIALFYMHLRYETRYLKVTVLAPLVAPAIYGIILMAETAWRLLRW